LGSFLFITFINDIFHRIRGSNIDLLCYADDMVMSSIIDAERTEVEFCQFIKKVLYYFEANHLLINIKKTKAQYFNNKSPINENIFIGNDIGFQIVSEYKYLGINIDCNFKFKTQYMNLHNKLRLFLKILYKAAIYLDKKTISNMYICYMLPYIEYGSSIYFMFNRVLLNKIDKINNRILKFTCLDTQYSIENRLLHNITKHFIKIITETCPLYINFNSNKNNTRHNIALPIINKSSYFKSYNIWCKKIYIILKNKNYKTENINMKHTEQISDLIRPNFSTMFN